MLLPCQHLKRVQVHKVKVLYMDLVLVLVLTSLLSKSRLRTVYIYWMLFYSRSKFWISGPASCAGLGPGSGSGTATLVTPSSTYGYADSEVITEVVTMVTRSIKHKPDLILQMSEWIVRRSDLRTKFDSPEGEWVRLVAMGYQRTGGVLLWLLWEPATSTCCLWPCSCTAASPSDIHDQ